MKLPDFFGHSGLNELRFQMGASQVGDFKIRSTTGGLSQEDIRAISTAGIDVEGDSINFLDDGTLTYRGLRVLVYIRDIANYRGLEAQDRMPRFHVAGCRTLVDMKDRNRFARYVVATRNDGMFQVNEIRGNRAFRVEHQLSVCQNCLDRLAFNGFSIEDRRDARLEAVRNFDLRDFFAKYPKDLHHFTPTHTADTQPTNAYPADWFKISQSTKRSANFTCQVCTLAPSEREFLHVHHKDGQKSNCAPENLVVLCIRCHAEEHSHLKGTPDWTRFVERYGGKSM